MSVSRELAPSILGHRAEEVEVDPGGDREDVAHAEPLANRVRILLGHRRHRVVPLAQHVLVGAHLQVLAEEVALLHRVLLVAVGALPQHRLHVVLEQHRGSTQLARHVRARREEVTHDHVVGAPPVGLRNELAHLGLLVLLNHVGQG
jgi:hypothetical protein